MPDGGLWIKSSKWQNHRYQKTYRISIRQLENWLVWYYISPLWSLGHVSEHKYTYRIWAVSKWNTTPKNIIHSVTWTFIQNTSKHNIQIEHLWYFRDIPIIQETSKQTSHITPLNDANLKNTCSVLPKIWRYAPPRSWIKLMRNR